jgi:hypothetical protein
MKMKYSEHTLTLVRLAKKTNNMPTLMYAVDQLHIFRIKHPEWNWKHRDIIKTFYDTISMSNKLTGQKLEDNFKQIMNNWKEFKHSNITI